MSDNPSSSDDPNADQNDNSDEAEAEKKDASTTKSKLRKIPQIPIHRSSTDEEILESTLEEDDDLNDEDGESAVDGSSPILASALGLNHIRTRSTACSAPTPSRFSNSAFSPLNPINDKMKKDNDGTEARPKWAIPREPGRRCQWVQSKSLRVPSVLNPEFQGHHVGFATTREIQSPRFQAILRVTSGRRKRSPAEIKSFSHELNSKGVRPFPFWKSRALGRPEEIMVIIRAKFDRLKEEVNCDLSIFAGDLVSILEKNAEANPEWKETLEDLLVVTRQCAVMSANEFWMKCEGIVQNLDDRRQELPMGTLKQAHTRILFILTRCTRLVQFQKEGLFEDEHILGLHQLSDLGVYPEQIFGGEFQAQKSPLSGKEGTEKHTKKSHGQEWSSSNLSKGHDDQNLSSCHDPVDSGTAKSVDSSRDRISSWKKFPSAAEKNQKKELDENDTPSKDKKDSLQLKEKTKGGVNENNENLNPPECPLESSVVSSNAKRVTWGVCAQNVPDENSMICRICEVEIPTVYVEDHSRICTMADRCDLKGLTVNERLEKVAETLERILETCTPKSSVAGGSPDIARISTSIITEEFDVSSPKQNDLSRGFSEDMADYVPEADNAFVMDDLKDLTDLSCNTQAILTLDQGIASSSAGSTTPRSPLLTPRTSQIELFLGERGTVTEHENFEQINKLLDIAHCVSSINTSDYNTLEYLLDRLEDLKYVIQDRKVDALIVETFGRRIEKLLQEKYVHLCGQIDDEKLDSSSTMVDEDSSLGDDAIRNLRASPMNTNGKDRTSIEDFEIIKPISRGAFGRVFLARKRATGDLFAIKVLKKADMIRKNAVESILAERNILISVRNPFVGKSLFGHGVLKWRRSLLLIEKFRLLG